MVRDKADAITSLFIHGTGNGANLVSIIIDSLKVDPLPQTSDGMPTADTADLRRWNDRLDKIINGEI